MTHGVRLARTNKVLVEPDYRGTALSVSVTSTCFMTCRLEVLQGAR